MLLAAAVAAALSLSAGPTRLRLADGTLSLTNSRAGGAIFSATNLAPGQAARGTVTVSNSGSLPGELALTASPSRVGLGLSLVVRDVAAGSTVYSGPLTGLSSLPLGRLEPGAARTFAFSAALPASAGNAAQGKSTTVSYTWAATEARALRTPLRLRVRVPARQRLARGGRVIAYARCDQRCSLTARAALSGRPGRSVGASRVRAKRDRRLVLRLPSRSVRALLERRRGGRVSITVTGRTSAGAHKTVRTKARIAPPGLAAGRPSRE
jgi:spore coat-associated protein N